jgi:spore maturation protein CgeB
VKVLLAVDRDDYGVPGRGPSFAYQSLRGPIRRLGHELVDFDTFDPRWRGRPDATGQAIRQAVDEHRPDVVLCMLMSDEVPLNAIESIGRHTVTVNWFADDVWRFRSFSRRVAPAFQWSLTTSHAALRAYTAIGVRSLFTPWGFDEEVYRPVVVPFAHDVSFVGQRYGERGRTIDRLRSEGFAVEAWGTGWPNGRLEAEHLASVFCSSRINLSFSESSAGPLQRRGIRFRGAGRLDRVHGRLFGYPLQLKARPFEIAGCGAFQITPSLPELEECFVPGREIAVAHGYRQLRDQIVRWLDDDEGRAEVAAAARARSVDDHRYEVRLARAFEAMGLEGSTP